MDLVADQFKLVACMFSVFRAHVDAYMATLYVLIYLSVQWNLRLRPPFVTDQSSKIPKVSKSNHYIWNLL